MHLTSFTEHFWWACFIHFSLTIASLFNLVILIVPGLPMLASKYFFSKLASFSSSDLCSDSKCFFSKALEMDVKSHSLQLIFGVIEQILMCLYKVLPLSVAKSQLEHLAFANSLVFSSSGWFSWICFDRVVPLLYPQWTQVLISPDFKQCFSWLFKQSLLVVE